MNMLHTAWVLVFVASWLGFGGLLAWNHWRVRAERRRQGIPEENRSIRDARSMYGLILEGVAFLVACLFLRPASQTAGWQYLASMGFGVLSVAVLAAALRHLGLEWRIKAVVTEDHQLVRSGPYGVVRHPIFGALLALLIATVLVLSQTWAGWLAFMIYLVGTEIRINAEDGLLEQRFGRAYRDYRMQTPAYVPYLR